MNVRVTKAFDAVPKGRVHPETIAEGEVVSGRLAEIALQLDCGVETEDEATVIDVSRGAEPAAPAGASADPAAILAQARAEAGRIVQAARDEAARILEDAKTATERKAKSKPKAAPANAPHDAPNDATAGDDAGES